METSGKELDMKKDEMKIVICDDEPQILKELKRRVEACCEACAYRCSIASYTEPEQLVERLKKEDVDICLLDIDMPRMSGMDIARFINEKKLSLVLIFVTGQDMLVYESFRYHPFSFIRKSMLDVELEETLHRAVQHIYGQETFCLQIGTETIRLDLAEILYMEADGNYVKIRTGRETIRYRSTLSYMEETLRDKGFVRIHKGFLVNEQAVYRIGREELVLTNKETLPIGRSNREEVRRQLLKGLRG